jgi:hypothetical protein
MVENSPRWSGNTLVTEYYYIIVNFVRGSKNGNGQVQRKINFR